MSITELSAALGVRSSTLRFWEHQGQITPDREQALAARRYTPDAVRDARIVAALGAGGYPSEMPQLGVDRAGGVEQGGEDPLAQLLEGDARGRGGDVDGGDHPAAAAVQRGRHGAHT